MPDQPTIDPLSPEAALDAALNAHAVALPGELLAGVAFGLYPDDDETGMHDALSGTAWWQLTLHRQMRNDGPRPEISGLHITSIGGNGALFDRSRERLEIIRAWRRVFFEDKRPRPTPLTPPSSRAGRTTS